MGCSTCSGGYVSSGVRSPRRGSTRKKQQARPVTYTEFAHAGYQLKENQDGENTISGYAVNNIEEFKEREKSGS